MSDPVRELRWDSESADFVEASATPRTRSSKGNWWDKSYYGPSLEIASRARSRDKIRALKELEATGFVRVEWRKKKSPVVTVLKDF